QEPITKGYWEMTGLDGKGCHTTQSSNRASNGGDCSRCRSCYRRCRAAGLAGGHDTTLKGLRRYNCKWSLKLQAQHRLSWKLNLSCFGHCLDPATRACPDRGSESGSLSAAYNRPDNSTEAGS